MDDCDCPGQDSPLVDDVRAIGDDPRKGEFYSQLLPELLRPRTYRFILEVEAIGDFGDMEAMSHQVRLADDETLDYLIEEAKDILDDLANVPDSISAEMDSLQEAIENLGSIEARVELRLLPDGTQDSEVA